MGVSSKTKRSFALSIVAGSVLLGAHGCASVFGIESDRHLVGDGGDISDGGTVEAGPWSCLGKPPKLGDPATKVSLTVLLFDPVQNETSAGSVDGGSDLVAVDYAPLTGASLRYCSVRDPNCSAASPEVLTDDAGLATFEVNGDFSSFFEVKRSDLVPATFFPGPLLPNVTPQTLPTYDFTPSSLDLLAATVTTSKIASDTDGGLGHIFVTIYDCDDHQAPGVSLTIDNSAAQTVVFYSSGGLPTTKTNQTDNYGLAGAVNVPIGSLTVKATLVAQLLPIGTINVPIRPGAITFAWIRVRTL
jgi:hypothetical protein